MKILDTLLGRTKPVRANLDALFALPSAAVTLELQAGLQSSGRAGVCFKAIAGRSFEEAQTEINQLLEGGDKPTPTKVVTDDFDFRWVLLDDPELESLVTQVHAVNSTLQEHGYDTALLCSVFVFGANKGSEVDTAAEIGSTPIYLVYLFKRGTFYFFAPTGKDTRDAQLELRLRSYVGADLPVEADLARWFPLWSLPV